MAEQSFRREDRRLVTGSGRFTDDLVPAGAVFAAFLRSPLAHATIVALDTSAARQMPGVLAVFTGAELRDAGFGDLPCVMRPPGAGGAVLPDTPRPALAVGRVRHVGEAVAVAIATSEAAALDALDCIKVEYADLPVVADLAAARSAGAPEIWPFAPGNLAMPYEAGDAMGAAAVFAAAEKIVRVVVPVTRIAPQTMEPRSAWCTYTEASGQWHLHAPSQGVNVLRGILAGTVLKTDPGEVRVTSDDVGGGFGARTDVYPEYVAILFAARATGRAVCWRGSRSESILTDTHGRDVQMTGELAVDHDGTFKGLRAEADFALGAYNASFGLAPHRSFIASLGSVYRIPAICCSGGMVYTNTAPTGPYRGAGRPEAALLIESLVEAAARELGRDVVELRRQNMIRKSDLPYRTSIGTNYDSGDFTAVLDRAVYLADWDGFASRRAASARRGLLRGRGIACFVEVAGGLPDDSSRMQVAANGVVEVFTALQSNGQGHETVFPQLVADRLGLSSQDVRLRAGDSSMTPAGIGSFGSRSIFVGGSAMTLAADALVDAGKLLAAGRLGIEPSQLTYQAGRFSSPSGTILLRELSGLEASAKYSATFTFPNGAHVAEVEVDPETGLVQVVGYTAVDDCGTVLNETLAHAQVHGGIVQGLSQAIAEQCIYDGQGQLLTGSFMDYGMPRADDVPELIAEFVPAPTPSNPLGAKGVGEAGTTGALTAVLNAVNDAIANGGGTPISMPARSEAIWRALAGTLTTWQAMR